MQECQQTAPMNVILLIIVSLAFAFAGWREIMGSATPDDISPMEALSKAMVESAAGAVELAIGLVGVIAIAWTMFRCAMKRRITSAR